MMTSQNRLFCRHFARILLNGIHIQKHNIHISRWLSIWYTHNGKTAKNRRKTVVRKTQRILRRFSYVKIVSCTPFFKLRLILFYPTTSWYGHPVSVTLADKWIWQRGLPLAKVLSTLSLLSWKTIVFVLCQQKGTAPYPTLTTSTTWLPAPMRSGRSETRVWYSMKRANVASLIRLSLVRI